MPTWFSPHVALAGDVNAALKQAGFNAEPFGDEPPPAIHYRLGEEGGTAFYAEFLTPLFGSEFKDGRRDAVARKSGITAQKLRHPELLLVEPCTVHVVPGHSRIALSRPRACVLQSHLA
ncbi:MAG: GSU2403 family nucleotidyltransferase fold protein [Vicinamibacteria bacterium]